MKRGAHRIDRAAADSRRRRLLTPLGPLFMIGLVVLLVQGARWTDRRLHLPSLPGDPLRLLLGLPLVACGALLAATSATRFFRAHGTPVPFNPPKELVVTGPYAVTRNPMMTGLVAALIGGGFLLRSPALVGLFLPAVIALMTLVIRYVEEPELEERFGEAYRRYRATTPRFVPRFRRGRSGPL